MNFDNQNCQQQLFQPYEILQPNQPQNFKALIEVIFVNDRGQTLACCYQENCQKWVPIFHDTISDEHQKYALIITTPGQLLLATLFQHLTPILPPNFRLTAILFGTFMLENFQGQQQFVLINGNEEILNGQTYLVKMHLKEEVEGGGHQQQQQQEVVTLSGGQFLAQQGIVVEDIMRPINVQPKLVAFSNAWLTETTFSTNHFLHTTEGLRYDNILRFNIENVPQFVTNSDEDLKYRTIGLNSDLLDFGHFGQFQVKVVIKNTKLEDGSGRRLKLWSLLGWIPASQGKKEIKMELAMNYLNSNNCLALGDIPSEQFNFDLDRKYCPAPHKFLGQLLASPSNTIIHNGKLSIIFGFNFANT